MGNSDSGGKNPGITRYIDLEHIVLKGISVKRKMVLAHDSDSRRDAKPLFMAGYLA